MEEEKKERVTTHPYLTFKELLCTIIVSIFLVVVSLLFNAPLEELANPVEPPNPAKAPWYFLGLQEMVSYSAFIGGILVPAVVVIGLMLLPYLDRSPIGVGRWFPRERRVGIVLFTIFAVAMIVFLIIGAYFRGPNWMWVWPWQWDVPR